MLEFYPKTIYYPRDAVEKKIAAGDLNFLEKQLFLFVNRHKKDILDLSKEDEAVPSEETILDNLRAYILSFGTLNPALELGNILQEISKEVWFQNEKGKASVDEITEEWKELYSAKYREARLFETFILIEKNADKLIQILLENESEK